MQKIIPEITNGGRRIVLSETFLMHPSKGITIGVPLLPGNGAESKKLHFKFKFPVDTGDTRHSFEQTSDGGLQLTLFNALKGITHGGTTVPFGFAIDDRHFYLFFSLVRIAEDIGQMTITIHQD